MQDRINSPSGVRLDDTDGLVQFPGVDGQASKNATDALRHVSQGLQCRFMPCTYGRRTCDVGVGAESYIKLVTVHMKLIWSQHTDIKHERLATCSKSAKFNINLDDLLRTLNKDLGVLILSILHQGNSVRHVGSKANAVVLEAVDLILDIVLKKVTEALLVATNICQCENMVSSLCRLTRQEFGVSSRTAPP